ncbi:BEN domain-containing protein 2-like isoform X6 [Acipenser ruthenus]|uniref:BEN domain-containing protein 2-like isoform X6 n=1 Tax=Acipenser ruthenus TaxID=7906 RepID=UPI0027406930|nr:BEN domain-containing protein 2-like isoform X6 [Acipenser ruthenus]
MSCVHLALHQRQPCLLFIPQYCRRYCYHQTEAPGILLSSKVLQNRYSFSTRRKSNSSSATTSMVSELPEEPVCNAIPGVVYEYQPKYDQYGISGDYYSVDQQRTLGEILTYCQVMYDAIRKLDQKFDQLQAKVTNVQAVHLGPSLLKKKPVVPPSTDVDEVHIQVSPEGNAGLTMPQQIQTCPPFFQHQVGAEQPDIVSPAPSVHSPSLVLPFQSPNQHSVHLHSIVSTDFTAQDPEPCHSIGEASRDHLLEEADVKARHKTKQVGQPSRRSCTSPEWLVERFPSYDLREKGRDWRACISIINSAVRQMRFEARKLRKLQMNSTGQANPPGETPHNEKDEQREGDRTEEQPLGMVEAAEICVELESDSEEEYSSLPVLESPKLFSEESVEYLGNPMRGVRVAHSVMLAARQKRKPESAARFLIRHIFPDRVLLKSNVHGSKERGIPALDFSKISALREFLKEQFPEFKLNEDGYDWKVCVIAMNATIRRFRYDLQKFKRMTRADSR